MKYMALIGRHNVRDAQMSNRFKVSHSDLFGEIKDWPLELLIYTLEEKERQDGKVTKDDIRTLQDLGVDCLINFSLSRDGETFWRDIMNNDLTTFWKIYDRKK